MPKVDLRVHSRYSDRPTNFFLKRLQAPESMTEPEAAYALAKRRGMDFFTLTDSDTIAGCLQLAHYEDVFSSCETTVEFPEDECKVRLLVFGLSEAQLQKMLSFRGQILPVRDYLLSEHLLHAVATPLDILNSRLSPDHIEKLLLLFDHFESRSGGKQARTNDFVAALLDHLTPEFMAGIRRKWGIEPAGDKPWQKGMIGGSNDYCGQYIGLTYTEVPQASTPGELLEAMQRRAETPGGIHGSTLAAAHSIYRVAFQYYEKNLRRRKVQGPDIVSMMLAQVLVPGNPAHRLSTRHKLAAAWQYARRMFSFRRRPSIVERRLVREFNLAYRSIPAGERLSDIPNDDLPAFDERLCRLADRVISEVSFGLMKQAAREFERGRVANALTLGSAVMPLNAILGPYLYAFNKLNLDRPLIARIERQFAPVLDLPSARTAPHKKIAWFSDTVNDVNGVSLTLNRMAEVAEAQNADLTIITSVMDGKASRGPKFVNFEPVGELSVPDYETFKLSMPPGLRMIRYLETAGFTGYVISTPGPVGLLGLLASRMFHVPCRAIYHNDFPQHVRHITGDEDMEAVTWMFMRWFYGKADLVYSPSRFYAEQLVEHGFDPKRILPFNRGTDLETFNPRHRDERFFEPWGIKDRVVFSYVGRVSREKNLDMLLTAFLSDADLTAKAALAIVGDGPYFTELKERYKHPAIAFCGFIKGRQLARAYASSDVFVFPSMTDTYGNSVLEAQASGLPAIVSNEGGPREIILPGESGMVLQGHDGNAWRLAMRELAFDRGLRERMASAARARAATRDWTTAFLEFWEGQSDGSGADPRHPRFEEKLKTES
ncbi:MAG TPA: glycosyltransferase [bacterium]|jgi:glycosyltransferase involved in cell wall biosynthesis